MAEVAGLVLGGLPIAIEIAKHYKSMYRVYSRYRNCGTEVEEFQSRLQVEQTSFCNEIQLLLASLTNFETANKILAEDNHPLEQDAEIKKKFAQYLGDSGLACMVIMEKIKGRLSEMEEFLGKSAPNETKRDFFDRTKRKLRFSFSQSHLDQNLTELRRLNTDFLRMSSQINRLKLLQETTPRTTASTKVNDKAQQYEAVRQAATQLFEALGHACSVHPEHWAHIQLEPEHIAPSHGEPPLVRFIMALTEDMMTRGAIEVEPIWIVIESIVGEASSEESIRSKEEVEDALSQLKRSLKRVNDTPPLLPKKKRPKTERKRKMVRFQSPEPEKVTALTECPRRMTAAETVLPDFSQNQNFCLQVRKLLLMSSCGPDKCIGYLRRSETCRHRVLSNPSIRKCPPRQSMSLAHLINLMSKRSYNGRLLPYESLKLARQLASAVLQFHTTPLLKSSWRSDDVVFFGLDEKLAHESLTLVAPHLNVHVKDNTPQQNTLINVNVPHGGFVGNPYLFGLGIVLIELHFQVPFRSLREDIDLVDNKEDIHTDFRTAERVSESIGKSLGATYGRIVRRCLYCDFGQDSRDLRNSLLQAAFHREVICELEELERRIKRFQIGD